jgi:hypothetical protein
MTTHPAPSLPRASGLRASGLRAQALPPRISHRPDLALSSGTWRLFRRNVVALCRSGPSRCDIVPVTLARHSIRAAD